MKQQLLELLQRYAPEGETVTPDSRLREDLDLNSLSMMMILWELEQLLHKEQDLARLSNVKTVADLLEAVEVGEA